MFAMTLAGMATEQGLKVIADLWRDFVSEGSTHWQEVAHRNRLTLQVLDEQGLKTDDFTPQDERIIHDQWTFPLHHEDLSTIKVDPNDLREKQRRWVPDY